MNFAASVENGMNEAAILLLIALIPFAAYAIITFCYNHNAFMFEREYLFLTITIGKKLGNVIERG